LKCGLVRYGIYSNPDLWVCLDMNCLMLCQDDLRGRIFIVVPKKFVNLSFDL